MAHHTPTTGGRIEPLSGRQIELSHGSYTAAVASIGASLRSLKYRGRDLVVPFDPDQLRPLYRGAILAPWPNRITDGKYSFGGVDYQLPLTEVARGHALHGLVAWHDWSVVAQSASTATFHTDIPAQEGYPFHVGLDLVVVLNASGLHSTVTATNHGSSPAPYGAGPHPYLTASPGIVNDWQLKLPAATVLEVSGERLIPSRTTSLDRLPAFDFRQLRPLGAVEIDHAFTDLLRTDDGVAEVRLESPSGGTAMTWDQSCPWVQIHTADRPEASNHRIGLAVEPMTCPPDAFNSGTDLVILAPGASHTARWSIRSLEAEQSPGDA